MSIALIRKARAFGLMNFRTQLKNYIRPRLPEPEDTESVELSATEKEVLFALLGAVTADHALTEAEFSQHLERRISEQPGFLITYREAAARLSAGFAQLDREAQHRALKKILRPYQFRENDSNWRKQLRLTSENFDLLLSSPSTKRFRQFVVRDFLDLYYRGPRAWESVGYENYPGKPLQSGPEGVIESVKQRGGDLFLSIDDGSFEKFRAKNLDGDRIHTKGGRQTCTLSGVARQGIHEFLKRPAIDVSGHRSDHFDCIIVGSGPLGAAAASVLVKAGLNVAMLEAGTPPDEDRFAVMERTPSDGPAWDYDPWAFELHGDDLGLNTFSLRRVGGSSLAWGAVTPRFIANDFKLKSKYGVGIDWPIDYDEIEEDYAKSERFIGVSADDDNPFASQRSAEFPMPAYPWSETDRLVEKAAGKIGIKLHSTPNARNTEPYEGRSKCLDYGVCRACPIGAMFSSDQTIDALKWHENFTLFTEANVSKVLTDAQENLTGVRYHDRDGQLRELHAPRVILAAQAIENVRLLLLSKEGGLANSSGVLGKYLTEHVKFYLTGRVDQKLTPYARGYETATSMQFHDHENRGEWAGARLLIRENAGPTPLEIALESGKWGAELKEEIDQTFGRFITLGAFMEQLPYEKNRVDLSPTVKDRYGNPAARIHFDLMAGDYEKRGYEEMKKVIRQIFDKLGAHDVRVEVPPLVSGHYMGTHRMGDDPNQSVTDSHLESHDVKGLYLASYGAFPTGGISNPVPTGVALSIRMAEKIASEFHPVEVKNRTNQKHAHV
ncbi:MAG: choline dehydrogenase-like flavoprotein [Verrucomicrobiales bacterium]|jgi:choline dehydrogenase-like flavoprotein